MAVNTVETYANLNGVAPQVSINSQRRLYNFGNRIAEIEPQTSAFFSYISKLRKQNTDDSHFKFLEQRHQWQRRNFEIHAISSSNDLASDSEISGLEMTCHYTSDGRTTDDDTAPEFFIQKQMIALEAEDANGDPVTAYGYITNDPSTNAGGGFTSLDVEFTAVQNAAGTITHAVSDAIAGYTLSFKDGARGQVIGSAFAQGTGAPLGWQDDLYDRDGYTQIFKTAIPLFSGTARATRYRGISNEYMRVWKEKLKEHKADLNSALLFGVGRASSGLTSGMTWGIIPYTEYYGNTYNLYYASSTYDDLMDKLESYFAPESGNSQDKLVLTSRKVINWLNKLGDSGFLKNTIGTSQYSFSVDNIKGEFGHNITKVSTVFGNLHFMQEPMLRGWREDYAVAIDLKNIAYRPLVGNGISRDTFIKTNVQDNDVDGRKDMITTEAGLEINLPETHAIFKFS